MTTTSSEYNSAVNKKKREDIIQKLNNIIDSATLVYKRKGHTYRINQIKNPYSVYRLPDGKEIARVSAVGKIGFFLIDLADWEKYRFQPDGTTHVTWRIDKGIKSGTEHFYVKGNYIIDGKLKSIQLHQLIQQWFGHGCKEDTVDHRYQCTLNNMSSNLRIVNQQVQNRNQGIVKIKSSSLAKLPEGFDPRQKIPLISWEPTRGRFVIQNHALQKSGKYKPVIYSSGKKALHWTVKWEQIKEKLEKLNLELKG